MKDFKVRCVKNRCGNFTEGKTYEVKNGILTNDKRVKSYGEYSTVHGINSNYNSVFELVTEPFGKADMKDEYVCTRRDGTAHAWFETAEECYVQDLTTDNNEYDIMAVYDISDTDNPELVWKRGEKQQMTVQEAVQKMMDEHGYDVEVTP